MYDPLFEILKENKIIHFFKKINLKLILKLYQYNQILNFFLFVIVKLKCI